MICFENSTTKIHLIMYLGPFGVNGSKTLYFEASSHVKIKIIIYYTLQNDGNMCNYLNTE